MVRIHEWDMALGPLSVDAVKALHDGPSFHISRKEYPAGARFEGAGRASLWYVLGGSCVLNLGQEYELVEGSVVELPKGEYGVSVGSAGLVMVQVVDLVAFMN